MDHFSEGHRGGTPLPGAVWVSGLQGSTSAGGAAVPVLQQEGGGFSVCRTPTAREEVCDAQSLQGTVCAAMGACTAQSSRVCADGNCIVLGSATEG